MKHVALALVALALAACASTSTTDSSRAQSAPPEKEYRTGSRIPVRDPVPATPPTTVDASTLPTGAAPRAN
ncbi:MAG: hypothetical protein U1F58_09595 [Burkholderiales bacterium]